MSALRDGAWPVARGEGAAPWADASLRAVPGLPEPSGAHELAWACILDRVFADAVREGLDSLRVEVPFPELADGVRLRADLTRRAPGPGSGGLALLAGGERLRSPGLIRRLYTLEAGFPAPRAVRRALPRVVRPGTWMMDWEAGVLTPAARALGAPLRLAAALDRPDLADRVMAAVRRRFVREVPGAAYYRLKAWRRA